MKSNINFHGPSMILSDFDEGITYQMIYQYRFLHLMSKYLLIIAYLFEQFDPSIFEYDLLGHFAYTHLLF